MIKKLLSAGTFALTSFFLAFGLSWLALYQMNFSYGLWHDVGGIGEAIEKYGPQNYYRTGFADTTKAQREELFQKISYSVHRDGEGLASITYKVPSHPEQKLLTKDEIIHLTDVAHLVNKVEWLIVVAALLWVIVMVHYYRARIKPPSVLYQSIALVALIAFFVLVLVLVGPTKAFSQMHEWVFPPGNPWFFYYQQSLMSTMMWAPVLFGWIAAQWAVFTVLFFALVQLVASRFLRMLIKP
ncbi:MAG TPA: DUF1461 domain-containing protein [Marinagarivorans sp.]